jgi:8-oxo-dGTP pyrophosphatase MutT (NUDIX family)
MGRRIDYIDDPDAPKANSLVPSVNAIVTNATGHLLLIERTDNGNWSLPGGAMDLGETIRQATVRETLEETGIQIEITGISGIYTDPKHVLHYTSNDEVRQEFSVVFTARPLSGKPTPSNESSRVEWVSPDQLDGLQMNPSMRKRLRYFQSGQAEPYLD